MCSIQNAKTPAELNTAIEYQIAELKEKIRNKYDDFIKSAPISEAEALYSVNMHLCGLEDASINSDDVYDSTIGDLIAQKRYDMVNALINECEIDILYILRSDRICVSHRSRLKCFTYIRNLYGDDLSEYANGKYDEFIQREYNKEDAGSLVKIIGIDEVKRLFPGFEDDLGPKSATKTS